MTQGIGEMGGASNSKLRNLDVSFRLCGARAGFLSDKESDKRDNLDVLVGQWCGYRRKEVGWGAGAQTRCHMGGN